MPTHPDERLPSRPRSKAAHGPDEVKRSIREAAATLFADHGYTSTSTKAIAEHAGVTEALLFRHFGDKPELFREAIHAPLAAALTDFVQEQTGLGENLYSPYEAGRGLIAQLHVVLSGKQKGALIAWTGALAFLPEVRSVLDSSGQTMNGLLVELERILIRYAAAEDFIGLNPPLSARLVIGTVIGMTVFKEWVDPGEQGPVTDVKIIDELAALLVHGLLFRITGSPGRELGTDHRASAAMAMSGPPEAGENGTARRAMAGDVDARSDRSAQPTTDHRSGIEYSQARRRRSDEIRPLILNASALLFARNGYVRTTTRAVAAESSVSEALVYKKFRTKKELFEATVNERFVPEVTGYAEQLIAAASSVSEPQLTDFFEELAGFIRSIRGMLLTLMTADVHDATVGPCAGVALRRILAEMHTAVTRRSLVDDAGRPFEGIPGGLTGSAILALILGATVVDGVVFREPRRRVYTESVREEVVAMVLYGVSHRDLRGSFDGLHPLRRRIA